MKLKKSVYWKIFCGSVTFFCANLIKIILFFFTINNIKIEYGISICTGSFVAFLLNKNINTVPYDENDNDNVKFFILLIVSIIVLITQSVVLR